MKTFLVLLSLVGYALARLAYQFPDGYLEILGREASRDFSCEGRQYGYYADVANDCKVFHICVPHENEAREVVDTDQYSFICGNQTIFDQETLACIHERSDFNCAEASSLYELINGEFGNVIDE